jgi:hypothetical protein
MTMTTSTSTSRRSGERRDNSGSDLILNPARDPGSEPPRPTHNQKARFDRASVVGATLDGRAYAVVRPKKQSPRFLFTTDEGVVEVEDFDLPHEEPIVTVREDNGAVLLAFSQDSLWEVDFAAKTATKLALLGDSLYGVAYGPDARVIVAEGTHLKVLKRTEGKVEVERKVQIGAYLLASTRNGRLLATLTHDSDGHHVVLLGWHEGALRRLGRVKCNAEALWAQGGRIFVRAYETREIATLDRFLMGLDASPESFELVPNVGEKVKGPVRKQGAFAVDGGEGGVSFNFVGPRPKELGVDDAEVPRDAARLFEYTNEWHVEDEDTVLGWKRGKGQKRFAVYDGGRFVESELRVKDPGSVMTLRWDRSSCLATTARDTKVWMVDLRHGRCIPIATFEDDVKGLAFALGGLALAVTTRHAILCGVEGRRPGAMSRIELPCEAVATLYSGRVHIVVSANAPKVHVWGLYDETLRELCTFDVPSAKLYAREGRAWVEVDGGEWYEIVGVEAAWRAGEASPAKYEAIEMVAVPLTAER